MKYYVNNELVNYRIFKHYLTRSIKYQTNFELSDKEINYEYYGYYTDMKYNNTEITFKDKISYRIEEELENEK